MAAFNNADLAAQSLTRAPYVVKFPVLDGAKNVRVRIDHANNGLSDFVSAVAGALSGRY